MSSHSVKGMTYDRQSWLLLSANKIVQQKSACVAQKSDFIIQHRTCSILADKIGQLFCWSTNFVHVTVMVTIVIVYKWEIILISVIYFVSCSIILIFVH